MAVGRYISLREAIREGLLKRFAKAHKSEGDEHAFDRVLGAMTRKPSKADQASARKKETED